MRVQRADCPTCNDTNSQLGTLSIRRAFKNTTNQAITRLRFRIVDITTLGNRAGNEADLRAIDSGDITVTRTNNTMVPLKGTTVETPPAQALGGGLNSSMTVGTITMATPLAPGGTVNVQCQATTGVLVGAQLTATAVGTLHGSTFS